MPSIELDLQGKWDWVTSEISFLTLVRSKTQIFNENQFNTKSFLESLSISSLASADVIHVGKHGSSLLPAANKSSTCF